MKGVPLKVITADTQLWSSDEGDGFVLYCIVEDGCVDTGPCKVGVATDPNKRISSLQCGNWRQLSFAWMVRLPTRNSALDIEQYVLLAHKPSPYSGPTNKRQDLKSEWISAHPLEALQTALRLLNAEEENKFRRVG